MGQTDHYLVTGKIRTKFKKVQRKNMMIPYDSEELKCNKIKLEGHSVERRYLRPAAWIIRQGLPSTDDCQIVMKTSLSQCTSLVKFS